MDNKSENKATTPITHVAFQSKLRSVVRPSMHPCQGNWVTIGRAVVYYDQAATHLVQELNVGTVVGQVESTMSPRNMVVLVLANAFNLPWEW